MCKTCKKHNQITGSVGAPLRAALASDHRPMHDGSILSHGNYHPSFSGRFPMSRKNDAPTFTKRLGKMRK